MKYIRILMSHEYTVHKEERSFSDVGVAISTRLAALELINRWNALATESAIENNALHPKYFYILQEAT